jgi:hypothetical protein
MAATALLGLTQPSTGTLAGVWGDTINNEITALLESAVAGTTTLSTDADVTLTSTVSIANQARQAVLLFSGARTALRTITAPAQSKEYVVINATSGGFSVKLVGAGPTTGLTIVNGEKALVAWNGSDFVRVSTIGGPVSGTTGTFSGAISGTTGTFSGNVQMASANGGQLAGLRNRIINGNMGIFQRGTTAVTTNGAYGPPDRWINVSVGNTFSTSQQPFVSGDTLYDTGGAQYFTQIAVTSVAGINNYFRINQPIEDVRLLAGQTVTVSFWAKAASGTPNIGIALYQTFGTGGSPSADVPGTGQAQALTTTWTKYSKTFNVPSINGKTLGTTANTSSTSLQFWLDAGSTYNTESGSIGQSSKTVSIAQVQLEVGPVATPFEQRPYGMELALCQRYFQSLLIGGYGTNNSLTVISRVTWPLFVPMRSGPTIAVLSGTPSFFQGLNTASHSSIGSTYITTTTAQADINVTGGASTVGLASIQRADGGIYSASAEL